MYYSHTLKITKTASKIKALMVLTKLTLWCYCLGQLHKGTSADLILGSHTESILLSFLQVACSEFLHFSFACLVPGHLVSLTLLESVASDETTAIIFWLLPLEAD